MVSIMLNDNRIGIVHQMPYCCERPAFDGLFEKNYFGTWVARYHLAANFFGMNCMMGMSNLMKKRIIDECGGLLHFGQYAAEDYAFANAYLAK